MAEFLLELLSEEIPAGMQVEAADDFENHLIWWFQNIGIFYDEIEIYPTLRRLTLCVKGITDANPFMEKNERKGPRVDAPQQAIDGFLRSCGIKTKNKLLIQEDKKGKFYVFPIPHESGKVEDILKKKLPEIISKFTWKKSMRWGAGDLRWVRPLQSITAVLDGKPVVFDVGGIKSGSHSIKDFTDYRTKLKEAGIILDPNERYWKIFEKAQKICDNERLNLVEDNNLISEIAGLVETPFCIMGEIDKEFFDLPPEVLKISMKTHQKFLSVTNPKEQITHFITVANKHKPTKKAVDIIRKGNQRVLSARLADAKFFWEKDNHVSSWEIKDWEDKLEKMTYHNLLGTQADRVNRIAEFAKAHADLLGVKPDDAETVARLMKLDLCSDMVGEFPELQGVMGRYYFENRMSSPEMATACEEHYAPLGLKDKAPIAPLSVLLSLADKLDTLAGFWSVGIIPTSSGDKFALRRAALGVIRLILDNNLRLSLTELLDSAFKPFPKKDPEAQTKLMDFFHERLKIYLRDKHDIPADTIDACRFGQGETDFALLTNRAKALHAFRPDAEFQNLLQGFKRAHNILHAEQKKDGVFYEMPPEPQYFQDPTETELHTALNAAEHALPPLMEKEQFAQMLQTLANLRAPIDAFFTQVQVNSDQSAVRRNRLCLLHKLCSVMKTFADFSRLNG